MGGFGLYIELDNLEVILRKLLVGVCEYFFFGFEEYYFMIVVFKIMVVKIVIRIYKGSIKRSVKII